ncbi:MAG: hypothetical protein HKN47_27620 [Pirellulaceae bacterium]|nr:hypothetical protein [Pirellulaceae bacterium]
MSQTDAQVPTEPPKSTGDKVRKLILFSLLGIMVVALAYDYRIARPAVNTAYDIITTESEKMNKVGDSVFTNSDVQKLINKTPTSSFADGYDLVEVYSYNGGIPGRPHNLYAVYKPHGDKQMFYRHSKFVYERGTDVAPIATATVNQYSEEEIAQIDAADAALLAQQRRSAPPESPTDQRRDLNSATLFADYDKDNDLKLTGDEIPADIAQVLSEVDTDGDGAVSLEELDARMEATSDGGAQSRPGRQQWDPDTYFAEQDADSDGKLTGDEISGRMASRVAQIDKDGDGSISKEEMDASIQSMRERFGRGGGGETDDRPRGDGRPELED